jgi:transposase
MEWAQGIEACGRSFAARIVNTNAARVVLIRALVSDGLPTDRTSRIVVEQQLSGWREIAPDEYCDVLCGGHTAGIAPGHAVYETASGNVRVLVPALAIMRMLFRPTEYLLPAMFSPQALDRVRILDVTTTPPRVEFFSKTWRDRVGGYSDRSTPISWMSAFPSAIRFAASVHINACAGRIAVSLPNATARLALQGRLQANTLFVTHGTLLELNAAESPLGWIKDHPLQIYKRATSIGKGPHRVLKDTEIALRPDGTVDLTDEEWDRIEPILLANRKILKPYSLDPRLLFDGILRKLALGSGWRATPYRVGSENNARFAYRSWRRACTFDAAVMELRRIREPCTPCQKLRDPK